MDDEDDNSGQQITIQTAFICDEVDITSEKIDELVKSICQQHHVDHAIISVAVADDEHIQRLNREFLEKDRETDVLSFDLSDDGQTSEKCFEIVVNAQLAARMAENQKHSDKTELALYITHGLLHQLGYDDQQSDDAVEMHKAEESILKKKRL